jgi:pimeloyl-ACP methyl ester carboxylesterase
VRSIEPPFAGSAGLPAPDLTNDGAGSVVEVTPIDDITDLDELNATVVRVVYRSTSGIDGSETEVSGVIAVPAGQPPRGGWPIVSFGHGTTGVLNKCGPSDYKNLLGSAPILAAFLLNGFVVAMTDYQGLGVKGYDHPYLDSETFGYNMIDAVRATRRVVPSTGDRWAAYGVSLGGMAAWAAADRATTYGAGLDLVGTAALVPVADMTELADAAANGTLNREQYLLLVYLLQGLAWSHHLPLDKYRSGFAKEHWDELLDCVPSDPDSLQQLIGRLQPDDLRPVSPPATEELRRLLAEMALPKQKTSGPMLVMYGTEDPLVNASWTQRALANACRQGDQVQIVERIGEGHADLDSTQSVSWVKDRFDDQRSTNSCAGPS